MEVIGSERLLDVAQVARKLHVSEYTVRRRIKDRQLRAFRVGATGGLRIRAKDVDDLLRPVEPKERSGTE